MTVGSNVRIERSRLGALTRLSAGGQGVVFAAPALRMQYASALVYKEYKPQAIAGLDVSVLEAMPAYLETLQFADGMELLAMSAWPCRLVEDAGNVLGFVMPAIPREFFLDLKKVSGVQSEAGKWHLLLNGDSFLARRQIPLTDRHRYELLADAASALAVLHRHGIAVGDLSPNNLLFSLSPHPRVFFIDCDAMRFQGRSPVEQLETPDWEVRAVNRGEELGTEASDGYKLALLALRLFAGDQFTRDPKRLPAHVAKDVRHLVSEGLSKSPSARPAPIAWVRPLLSAATTASTAPPSLPKPVPKATPVQPQPTIAPGAPPVPQPAFTTGQLIAVPTPVRQPPAPPTPVRYSPGGGWWQRRSGGGKLAVVAGIIAVVAIAASSLAGGGSDDPSGLTASGSPNAAAASDAGSNAPAQINGSVDGFVGTWDGTIEGGGSNFAAHVELRETSGELAGSIEHPDLPCRGTMHLRSLSGNVAMFDTEYTADSQCIQGGSHRLTLVRQNEILYEWLHPTSDRIDSGTLARVGGGSGSAAAPTTAAPPANALPSTEPGGPGFQVAGGSESRYSSEYAAQVTGVEGDGYSLRVHFDAVGRSDLRSPESSCVRIAGDDGNEYVARPSAMALSVEQSTNYAGTLTFPALISGSYALNYSCSSDYSLAQLGNVSVPSIGVSRYSSSYYAVVLSTSGNSLRFASHGTSDLRDPASSCLVGGGDEVSPQVSLDFQASDYSLTYIGTMTFGSVPPGAGFLYSCSSDYPTVPLS